MTSQNEWVIYDDYSWGRRRTSFVVYMARYFVVKLTIRLFFPGLWDLWYFDLDKNKHENWNKCDDELTWNHSIVLVIHHCNAIYMLRWFFVCEKFMKIKRTIFSSISLVGFFIFHILQQIFPWEYLTALGPNTSGSWVEIIDREIYIYIIYIFIFFVKRSTRNWTRSRDKS